MDNMNKDDERNSHPLAQHKIDTLRKIAIEMTDYTGSASIIRFPGWDTRSVIDEEQYDRIVRIQRAALCILNTADYDKSMVATTKDIGCLLHYIADMMEVEGEASDEIDKLKDASASASVVF